MDDIENDKENKNATLVLQSSKGLLQAISRKPLVTLRGQYNVQPKKDTDLQETKQELQKNPLKLKRSRSANDVYELLEDNAEVGVEFPIVKKPAQKTNFIRKLSKRSSKLQKKEQDLYADYLFDDEYLEDNFKYMLAQEDKYVFKKDILDDRIGSKDRQALIDWVVQFAVPAKLDESTMFSAVRMFDKLLVLTDLRKEKFEVAMLTCLWIVSKLLDTSCSTRSLIFDTQCTRSHIVQYERKIIKVLDFQLNIPEPVFFLSYYLRKHSLEQHKTVRCIATFFLEYFMTLPQFSSSAPSLLAGTALYLALRKLPMLEQANSLKDFIGSHVINEGIFKQYASAMYYNVKQALRYKDRYNGIYSKYSTGDKMRVSTYFKT